MTLLEAIEARHSVRKYTDEAIPDDVLATLRNKVWEINKEAGLHVQLVTDEPRAFGGFKSTSGVFSYGAFTNVRNYFIMAGKKSDDLDEKVGYWGEQLVLLAQTLGLNTCWVGLSYSKSPGTYELMDDEKIACYISLGYGQNQGKAHKSKPVREVSNASDLTPKWFNRGVEAALFAPTAVNQQKFYIEYLGFKDYSRVPKVAARPVFSLVGYSKIDLGIVKYHFELGAGKESFEWQDSVR